MQIFRDLSLLPFPSHTGLILCSLLTQLFKMLQKKLEAPSCKSKNKNVAAVVVVLHLIFSWSGWSVSWLIGFGISETCLHANCTRADIFSERKKNYVVVHFCCSHNWTGCGGCCCCCCWRVGVACLMAVVDVFFFFGCWMDDVITRFMVHKCVRLKQLTEQPTKQQFTILVCYAVCSWLQSIKLVAHYYCTLFLGMMALLAVECCWKSLKPKVQWQLQNKCNGRDGIKVIGY